MGQGVNEMKANRKWTSFDFFKLQKLCNDHCIRVNHTDGLV